MRRLPLMLFLMLLVACTAFIAGSAGQLPAQVATHFAAGGRASGWMTRDGYVALTLALSTLVPAVLVGLSALALAVCPRSVNIPNRAYWLADARRAETLVTLLNYACWLGCLLCLFIATVHYSILEANRTAAPQLPTQLFVGIIAAFTAALSAWLGALFVRFRKQP